MSFLQIICATKNNQIMPSPAKRKVFVQKLLSPIKTIITLSVKRIFGLISVCAKEKMHASMAVEASVLLPMILFFVIHLASVLEMLRLHGKVEAALWNVGNQMTVYINTFATAEETISGTALSYLVVDGQMKTFLEKDYLEESPLVHGMYGLNYLRSDCLDENECVDITITYQVAPKISVYPFGYRRMYSRYYGRAWTGYDVTAEYSPEKYVYVTPHGEVWHATPDCTYLYHQIFAVDSEKIAERINADGRKYELCELCERMDAGTKVYITEDGEKYHLVKSCRAIYKKIIALQWKDGLEYRSCSKCVVQ